MIDILLGACLVFNAPHVDGIGSVRFINVVTNDPHGAPEAHLVEDVQAPYIDPPKLGWKYGAADTSPYYWDDKNYNGSIQYKINNPEVTTEEYIKFKDCPTDPRLKKGEAIEFTTCSFNTNTETIIDCIGWALLHTQRTILRETDNRHLVIPLLHQWKKDNDVCNLCSE